MAMGLLFPAALAALVALIVPLVIHIARRSEQQPTNFAALRWLRQKPRPRSRPQSVVLEENEWLAIDLAPRIGIAKNTLLSWIKRGWVHVSRRLPGYHGRVICWVNAEDLKRLCRLQETKRNWWDQPLSVELATPKAPPKKGADQQQK